MSYMADTTVDDKTGTGGETEGETDTQAVLVGQAKIIIVTVSPHECMYTRYY